MLRREIWTLTSLNRLEEAVSVTNQFKTVYFAHISDEMKARFLMDEGRLYRQQGASTRAMQAFIDGIRYRHALPVPMQAHFLLNGAMRSLEAGRLEEAAGYAEEARMLVVDLSGNSAVYAHARALKVQAEIYIARGINLAQAEANLEAALAVFEAQARHERLATTLATQGLLAHKQGHAAAGYARFAEALAYAQTDTLIRPQIVVHHWWSTALNEDGHHAEAEYHARAGLALSDSADVAEFKTELLLTLGNALLGQGALAAAQATFTNAEAEARDPWETGIARAGLLHLAQAEQDRLLQWISLWVCLALLLGYTGGYFMARNRTRIPLLPNTPTARPEAAQADPALLACIHTLCFSPEQHRHALMASDPTLYGQLTGSDQKDLQSVKILSLCLAAVDGYTGQSAYGTYRKKLSDLRRELGWPAGHPKGIYGWRLWFLDQDAA